MSFVACPSCSCHVRSTERACPHCDAILVFDGRGHIAQTAGAMLLGLAVGVGALGAGCANEIEIVDGAGGSGATKSSSSAPSSSSSKMASNSVVSSTSSFNVSSTYGAGPSSSTGPYPCNQLPCVDQDTDPFNDCTTCSQQLGQCQTQSQTCSNSADCAAFTDCLASCPPDDPATANDENLSCICSSNDGSSCDFPSAPGTCVGDYEAGVNDYIALVDCVYGDGTPGIGECSGACF